MRQLLNRLFSAALSLRASAVVCVFMLMTGALIPSLQAQKIYTTYLWHMDQPVYWGDKSVDHPNTKQYAEESHRLKMSGGNLRID